MKSLARSDLLEQLYEKAVAAEKKNTQHWESLFLACLRSNNSTRQISCAMELWKLTNDDKYLMWSIVARALPEMKAEKQRCASIAAACPVPITAQFKPIEDSSGTPSKPNTVLTLAHMMFETKFLSQNKVKSHLEFDFIIRVLLQLGHGEKAVDMLRTEQARRLYGISFQRLSEEAAILLRIGKTQEAKQAYETLLNEHNSDEWSWYLGYFEAIFGENFKTCPPPSQDKVEEAKKFIKMLQEKNADGIKVRGSFLAELELEKICGKTNSDLIVAYFKTFASKPSTYRDVLPYIRNLSDAEQNALIEGCKPHVLLDSTKISAETPLGAFIGLCTFKGLVRALKAPKMSLSERKAEIEALWALYNAARKYEQPREATERFCADDLLSMIAHYYCDNFVSEMTTESGRVMADGVKSFDPNPLSASSPLRHLVAAASALECGIAHSKWNFQFKLLLNEVYGAMGAIRSLIDQFHGVEVKHVQLDSVAWLFVDPMLRNASMTDLHRIVKKTWTFYDESKKSTFDYAFDAFTYGSYHKVREVMQFAQKLDESSYQLALRLEHAILSISENSFSPALLASSFDAMTKLPNTMDDVKSLYCNYDDEALDWWSTNEKEEKNFEIPSGHIRSACFPGELQHARILCSSLFIQTLMVLAEYQPPAQGEKQIVSPPSQPLAQRLAPLVSKLEEASSVFQNHELLVWKFVIATYKMTLSMFSLSPNLASDKPDAENVNAVKECAATILNSFATINDTFKACGDGEKVISTTNAPLLTHFVTRALLPLPLCLPLLPKLLPGKARPKTPDEVKTQTSSLKALLRDLAEACRKQLAHLDAMLTNEASTLVQLTATAASSADIFALPENQFVPIKTVQKVLDSLAFSRKDAIQTLQNMIQIKIKDYKSI